MHSRSHESWIDETGQFFFLKWRDYHLLLPGKTIKPNRREQAWTETEGYRSHFWPVSKSMCHRLLWGT